MHSHVWFDRHSWRQQPLRVCVEIVVKRDLNWHALYDFHEVSRCISAGMMLNREPVPDWIEFTLP